MANRKLGKASDQRVAMLRNLTTALLWNGKIVTTEARAKEVRSIAESQIVKVDKVVDKPSKLHARRMIMAYLYDVPEPKQKSESKSDYRERTADRVHPVVEKLFRDIAPKYDKRNGEVGRGGYTRIYKLGPRRGDAADMVVLELV